MLKGKGKKYFRGIAMALASLMLMTSVPIDGLYALANEPDKADTAEVYFDEDVSDKIVSEKDAEETVSDKEASEEETISDNEAAEEDSTEEAVSDNEAAEGDSAEETVSDDRVFEEGLLVASGSYGNVTWSIDKKGNLTVEGTGNAYELNEYNQGTPPWLQYSDDIVSAKVKLTGATSLNNFFLGLENLKNVDLSGLKTDSVTNMARMFSYTALETLDLRNFNTSKVTTMGAMFSFCADLKSVDVSSFDTSKVTGMAQMFEDCESLTGLDLSGFDTRNVESFHQMFKDCKSLTSLDVSSFDTTNVKSMYYMFSNCSSLTSLDLGSFNTAKVTNMARVFNGCTALRNLNVSSFNTTSLSDSTDSGMVYMFKGCSSLTSLDLSSFNLSSITVKKKGNENVLQDCDLLSTVKTPVNLGTDVYLPGSGWKRSDTGEEVTQLPQGLNKSITLKKDGPVTQLLFEKDEYKIAKGDEFELAVIVSPASGDTTGISWKSDSESVATVVGNGTTSKVKAVGTGTAKITVTLGKLSATTKVTVFDPIFFDVDEFTLVSKANSARKINVTLAAPGYSADKLIWTSSNKNVATVDNNGLVTAVPDLENEGVTVIKAETPDAKYSATCTVRVTVPATSQAPTASVKSGEVNKGTKVLLSTSTYGATIFYTTDGSVPSYDAAGKPLATTKIYNDAIIIEKNVVIKAIAVCDGYKDSAVATFEYTVKTASWGDIENDKEVKDIFKDVSEVPEGMWFALDGKAYRLNDKINFSIAYTGDKITFNDRIKVYDSTKRLWENTDYTVTYKNNQAVASKNAGKKAPLFIIKGKGNYEKAAEFAFDIVAADINSAKLTSEKNICVNPGTKLGSVKPQLSFNGKKLTAGKDFTLSFVNGISADTKAAAGETYEISIIGKGSFTDTFGDKLTVKAVDPKDSSVTAMTKIKVNIPKAKDLPYDKNGYDLVALFDNSDSKAAKVAVLNGKVSLEYGKDFTVSSSDADANGIITAAGKHSVTVHGKGKYVGDKVAILEISGIPANKVKITGLNTNAEYTGKAYTLPDGVKLTSALGNLEQGKDYDVEIHDNGSVGKVNVVFTFKGQYTGTVKKVINVKARNISSAKITVSDAQYSKSGAVPESVTVKIDNETLIEGIDYTLSYKNNAKVADKNSGKSAPVVVVKGKGNYTGSKSEFFTVGKADITKCVSLVSVDKVYSEKAGSFRSEPKLTDNSKAIALGKDIDKFDKKTAFKYCYAANGEEIPANAVVPADTIIEVRLTVNCGPQSPYKAGKYELKGYYKILGKGFDIKAAKVSVKDPDKLRFNNGKEIIPDLVVTMNNKPLGKDDYEIVSISSNRFLGTASVTIRGKGKYGGTNTFKFKIGARSIFG